MAADPRGVQTGGEHAAASRKASMRPAHTPLRPRLDAPHAVVDEALAFLA